MRSVSALGFDERARRPTNRGIGHGWRGRRARALLYAAKNLWRAAIILLNSKARISR